MEEEVEVAEDNDVGVDEDDLVVVGELPEAELAVVVLVVGVLLGVGVPDALDDADLPPGGCEGVALGRGDGVVDEKDEVAFGSGFKEALGECDGTAHVSFGGVEDCGIGFSFHCLCAALDPGYVVHFVYSC